MNVPRRFKQKSWVNQNGGSGKSILSYNDAFYLAELGKRVLYTDFIHIGGAASDYAQMAGQTPCAMSPAS